MNSKQIVFAHKYVACLDTIAMIRPPVLLAHRVMSIDPNILLVVRDREDEYTTIEPGELLICAIFVCSLHYAESGPQGDTAATHVLSISIVETFNAALYIIHREGEEHFLADLCPIGH